MKIVIETRFEIGQAVLFVTPSGQVINDTITKVQTRTTKRMGTIVRYAGRRVRQYQDDAYWFPNTVHGREAADRIASMGHTVVPTDSRLPWMGLEQ